MGTRHRAKRAASARQRAKQRAGQRAFDQRGFGRGAPPLPTVAELAVVVLTAAEDHARGDAGAVDRCVSALVDGPFAEAPTLVDRAVEMAALDGLTHAWRLGWQPADLWQLTRRQLPAAVSYLVDMFAADADRHSEAALAPAWSAQLRRLGAQCWWRADQPHLGQWTARHQVARADALTLVARLLAHLRPLSRMSELIPPPGSPAARGGTRRAASTSSQNGTGGRSGAGGSGSGGTGEADPKVLARVRALLAKAESTEFAEEADAFFAKAQELMSRYALERAMLEVGAPHAAAGPGGRRIWLDAPYVSAKSLLINAVAAANRSRTVFHEGLGCVTVLGDEIDLELVEVLSTSLLVHASQAMLAAGRQIDRRGQSRTKSFRQSFLVSYAARIGERLSAAAEGVAEAVAGELGDERLLPVLAARGQQVDELFTSLFPTLTSRRVSVSNAAGWGAGRVAADLANLDVRRAVGG